MRAAYARLSRDRDGLSTSIADQLAEIRVWAGERGWELTEFSDNDISASGTKPRPAWTQMLAELDSITDIVCWASDRLYRQPKDLEILIEKAERGELTIHALHTGMLDLTTADGRGSARISAVFNRMEAEKISERIKRKMRSLETEGKHGGGPRR